jgi:hypothetical protein
LFNACGNDLLADQLKHGLVGLVHMKLEVWVGAVQCRDHDPTLVQVLCHPGKASLKEALEAARGILLLIHRCRYVREM